MEPYSQTPNRESREDLQNNRPPHARRVQSADSYTNSKTLNSTSYNASTETTSRNIPASSFTLGQYQQATHAPVHTSNFGPFVPHAKPFNSPPVNLPAPRPSPFPQEQSSHGWDFSEASQQSFTPLVNFDRSLQQDAAEPRIQFNQDSQQSDQGTMR